MNNKGIDVAKYQGSINWDAVKASGVQFAMIKSVSTNKTGLYIDPYFERNYAECKRLGIPCGTYYYTYAQDKGYADKELALLNKAISGKVFEYPITVDVEDNSLKPISKAALTDLVEYAANTIQSWGAYVMIYTYYYYSNIELDMSRLAKYDLWIACYTQDNLYKGAHGMWQYSSKGRIQGIAVPVDLNYGYKDYPTIIKNAGLNNFTSAPVAPQPTLTRFTVEVTNGDLVKFNELATEKKVIPILEVVK